MEDYEESAPRKVPRKQPSPARLLFGRNLRALRETHGFSLSEMEQKTGLPIPYLSKVELGRANLSIDQMQRLADAYGATVYELLRPRKIKLK